MPPPLARTLLVSMFLGGLCSCTRDTPPAAAAPEPARADSTPTPAPAAAPAIETTPEILAVGAAAWTQGMCFKCHLEDGTGSERAPDLTDQDWVHCDGSVAGIRAVLVSGVPKDQLADPSRPFAMNPATRLVQEEDALDALAAYVRSLSNEG